MELKEFVRLVTDLRAAQRAYYRTRSPAAMEEAKRLEKRTDDAVRECTEQPRLFG